MIREPFAEGHSWMHRIDPRLRVVGASAFTVLVAVADAPPALFTALGLSVVAAAAARLNAAEVARHLKGPALFVLMLWAVLPWSYEGPALAHLGPLTLTRPGVALCAQISLKTTALLVTFMALVATMSVDTLGHSLSRLRVPDKAVYLLLITYRYIFVLEQEYQRLVRAIKIRNFHPGTNLHSYRTYAYLVGMLFVRASERAHRVHCAMICRGFSGRFISLRSYPADGLNRVFSLTVALCLVLLATLQYWK
ncbi:MAG: cobalt ECF transporter T component CbiQ [Pseudomonadota bacterium]